MKTTLTVLALFLNIFATQASAQDSNVKTEAAQPSFTIARVVFYQPNNILQARLSSTDIFAAYIKQLHDVASRFFANNKKPETLDIVVALRPGHKVHVWFVSSTRAGSAPELQSLRAKLEAVPPIDPRDGPVVFAISAYLAGGDAKSAESDKNPPPPIPQEWKDAVKDQKTPLIVPESYLDAVWPDKN